MQVISLAVIAIALSALRHADGGGTDFAQAVLAAKPVAYWRLNETSGTTAHDSTGRQDGINHHVTYNAPGPVPPTFGRSGNSFYAFNGATAYVQTPVTLACRQGTLIALVNPTGGQDSGATICAARGSGANVCVLGMQNDGAALQYVWANDPGTWTFNPAFMPPPSQWSFVAVSVTPSNGVMYIDSGSGLRAATNTHAHAPVQGAGPMAIGGDPIFGHRNFDGGIAEVAVFDRPLALAEIAGIAKLACITNAPQAAFSFDPIRYRPLPAMTAGLATNCLLLDGSWALNPVPGSNWLFRPPTDPGWAPCQVPGQWKQQGFKIAPDQSVAMARTFTIPAAWKGRRIVLRLDSVHAGTTYWVNGTRLGYSENLFTPVEWDITDVARPGQSNRLDLLMRVDTLSEKLSHSSGYAFHSLGGIDRSVRVFALPPTCIRQLHLTAGLDGTHHHGELTLSLIIDSGASRATNLSLAIQLLNADGQVVQPSRSRMALPPFFGTNAATFVAEVPAPRQWSAEKPNLYRLTLELRQSDSVLERLERNIGFRTVEVRGRQLYVNGRPIKVAGASHHETHPLTGRADTMRYAETDVRLMKEANLNYIRTSHYPPPSELLDAADKLGMYVEVEAPFCWVQRLPNSSSNLTAVLAPTSAMIDYHHTHPSVIVWSVANESAFNYQFTCSTRLIKQLDPTRPTTFNNPGGQGLTDIANLHYPEYPYDGGNTNEPRPIYLGEYFFEITHEQTDVGINPGLRELWGHGHAEPEGPFAQALIPGYSKPPLKPGLRPGGWSYIVHSDRLIGGSIWAALDDAFYFSASEHSGYAWHHGFWGLIDSWRRPKPEWFLARHIFSPVWLGTRHPSFAAGQKTLLVPVENRYSFTDFSELRFNWVINGQRGQSQTNLAPGTTGLLAIPVPDGATLGDTVGLQVTTAGGALIDDAVLWLGPEKPEALPRPASGPPDWSDDGTNVVIRGEGFGMVLNRAKGNFDSSDARHHCSVISFPAVHVTQYDFGDLNGPKSPPYAVFPDAQTRSLDEVVLESQASGLRITVRDHYAGFAGSTTWLIDKDGHGLVSCDYTYSGRVMDTREAGIRFLLKPDCDELRWRRWSEWGAFPEESISRTPGRAKAHRDPSWGRAAWNHAPAWPWSLDETELGTADFRGVKFNIYEATLAAQDGRGLGARANADVHFRAALTTNGVAAHLLWRCPLAHVSLKPGDHLQGTFAVQVSTK